MNSISVPNKSESASSKVLANLLDGFSELTPELRKAASYVLENPNDVGVSSIREIAAAANVKPNTFVRMARTAGFSGYEDFRQPFREEIRRGVVNFPDRARWLQSLGQSDMLGGLYRDMVSAAITESRQTFTLGVGVNNSNAKNFTYLASTGMVNFHAIPKSGSTPIDDLAWADKRDVLIAITCKPFRTEVVNAVKLAREQGVHVIGISDSPTSPIIVDSDHGFVVAADTPQFFPSSVSTIALLETLLSFAIAIGTTEVVDRVKTFHDRRHQLGLYEEDK